MPLDPDFASELRKRFAGEIHTDLASRILYSTDASIYQIEPLGVVLPRTQDDLHAVVELAARHNVPILPRGSGTSLAGQAIGEAVIVDCSRWLDQIVEIDPQAHTAKVEPGTLLGVLNRAASKHGLQFGPDPASADRATMGGVIANNATGAHSIVHGMTADHLMSADVILADGTLETWASGMESRILPAMLQIREHQAAAIRQKYPTSWRNSAGYRLNYLLGWSASRPPEWGGDSYPPVPPGEPNAAQLLAGSEGTLAVIRRATVNLVPLPKHSILAILSFDSIAAACEAVPGLLRHHPAAIELVPQMLLRLARHVPAYAAQMGWVRGEPAALLVIEFSGEQEEVLKQRARAVGSNVLLAESAEQQANVWSIRKAGLGLLDSGRSGRRPVAFIEDCAIPVERLAEFVGEVERILTGHGTEAAFYAHASAGCLHIRPILDLKREVERQALRSIATAVLELTLRLGGSMSSEHGDGIARGEWLRQTYGPEIIEAFRSIKQAADPRGILNPGKIMDAPAMDSHLRYGPAYRSRPWLPHMDFAPNGGLAGAVEQCNGQGLCRKNTGVMCPSFQATREEKHSTRGRANLLRAMIAQPSAALQPGLQSAAASALDLCLACKGCKAECPSGVDMAKLKYEFQAEYYRTHRRPIRDYLFGYFNEVIRYAAPFGQLANWAFEDPSFRRIASKALGITEKRPLPHFAARTRRGGGQNQVPLESCLYLADTFTHFFEPDIEEAALELLSMCGVDASVLPTYGAGRTLISKGFLKSARRHAAHLLDVIGRLDPRAEMPILGVEPSEIYTLRDEFLDLLPDRRAEAESLAARAYMLEEYLIRPGPDGKKRILRVANISPRNLHSNSTPKASLHAHCYQKTQPPAADLRPIGQAATEELLAELGYDVETIPSGCCGMAGAFGYESEHYDVSMQVGELSLLPAARKADERNIPLVASGVSCRAQILDGAGLPARHPIVFARDVLLPARSLS